MKQIACRPRLKNIQSLDGGKLREGESIEICEGCGEEVVKRPELEEGAIKVFGADNVLFRCTECAFKYQQNANQDL